MTSTEADTSPGRWPGQLRLETIVPLLAAYLALCALYAWQAWRRDTPTIFTDELELTQISRAISATGHPARRGEPYGFTSLAPWLTAPFWWIGDVSRAYGAIKLFQTLVMAAAAFPAYALTRMVTTRPWSLFAAAGTIAVPALSYSPFLVEEPFAYPLAALALLLIARAVARPTVVTVGLAAAGSIVAAATRSQLVTLLGALLLSLGVLVWASARMRAWRSTWDAWDRIGAALLGVGAVFAFSSFMSWRSFEWQTASQLFPGRIFDYAVWATGALAIGVGILPLIATLAVVVRRQAGPVDPRLRAFRVVAGTSLIALVWYAGIKGAYLSTNFSSLVVERNLIYLCPLLFTGTALLLSRRDAPWWGILGGGAIVAYLISETPTKIDLYPYYEAHGLAILALMNRKLSWTAQRIDHWLLAVAVASTLLLLLLAYAGRRRSGWPVGVSVVLAALVLGWGLTGEIYAANGERRSSTSMATNLTKPFDWVDRATGNGSVVIVGQQVTDPTGLWLTEFWNRSVKKVWSVDPGAPAPGPGPTLTPDLAAADGKLTPSPGTGFALALNGVTLQAPVVEQRGTTILYRLDGAPLQLAYSQAGIYSDGWMGHTSSYNRFTGGSEGPGSAEINLSRAGFCTQTPIPGGVLVELGTLVVGPDRQARIGRVTQRRLLRVRPCLEGAEAVLLPTPNRPWRVEVTADTFVPAEVDPTLSDQRELGVQVSFGFQPQ